MIAVVQRVYNAAVSVENTVRGKTDLGLLVLVGVSEEDTEFDAEILASKIANLRIFCDENDKMNLSALDVRAGVLAISNFTLCADTKKGNRPSFIKAMQPHEANCLYERFCEQLIKNGVVSVEKGVFGADMTIESKLYGPVTIILDTVQWRKK